MDKEEALKEIKLEHERNNRQYPTFNSAHEGYAIIKEELDGLWNEIKKKETDRNYLKMREEARQIAAMALKFMVAIT